MVTSSASGCGWTVIDARVGDGLQELLPRGLCTTTCSARPIWSRYAGRWRRRRRAGCSHTLTQHIVDGHTPPVVVSQRFEFVELTPGGSASSTGPAPYLGYRGVREQEKDLVADLPAADWLADGAEKVATAGN